MISACFHITSTPENGPATPTNSLFSTLYFELHRLAKRQLARQWGPGNPSVTTLLHEAYLDMSSRDHAIFPDEARFMGYAARVMRGLIIDNARSRDANKRGGQFEITSWATMTLRIRQTRENSRRSATRWTNLRKLKPTLLSWST